MSKKGETEAGGSTTSPNHTPLPTYRYVTDPSGHERIETTLHPREILNNAVLNKGTAFPVEERKDLGLTLLLPEAVSTIEEQDERAYGQFKSEETDIGKNAFMMSMLDQNETLHYHLLTTHISEMLPIIYTPTEALAIQNYSKLFRRSRGLYLSYPNHHNLLNLLTTDPIIPPTVDLMVITDSSQILGIGDQGVGGIWISVAKCALYTALGGVHPARVLPIVLDVGTDNEELLGDELYTGWRHERIRGKKWQEFVAKFVDVVKKVMPGAYVHWEDFERDEARGLLDKYRKEMCTFNDDMQGTGVVTLAALQTATNLTNTTLLSHPIVIYGAGTAGTGIADMIATSNPSISLHESRKRIYLIDKQGFLTTDTENLTSYQKPYAHNPSETTLKPGASLLDVVKTIKPAILIGVSTHPGGFTKQIIESMAENCPTPHPIIFPLSNPTSLAEAQPRDLFKWTKGKCVVATGGPSDPVTYNGETYVISEVNNAFGYPGIGLGCIVSGARGLSDHMLQGAVEAISSVSREMNEGDIRKGVMPGVEMGRRVSFEVAVEVARRAVRERLAEKIREEGMVEEMVRKAVWRPQYCPVVRVREIEV